MPQNKEFLWFVALKFEDESQIPSSSLSNKASTDRCFVFLRALYLRMERDTAMKNKIDLFFCFVCILSILRRIIVSFHASNMFIELTKINLNNMGRFFQCFQFWCTLWIVILPRRSSKLIIEISRITSNCPYCNISYTWWIRWFAIFIYNTIVVTRSIASLIEFFSISSRFITILLRSTLMWWRRNNCMIKGKNVVAMCAGYIQCGVETHILYSVTGTYMIQCTLLIYGLP